MTGDAVTVTVQVPLSPARAFAVFTEETDLWWRRGPRFRVAGREPGRIYFEAGAGGRLLESFATPSGERVVETGRITEWTPGERLAFEWRASNFAAEEKTFVEVLFAPSGDGTKVTVRHSGWSAIRTNHPVRHGQDVEAFVRTMGMWWGDLMRSLRECSKRLVDA